MPSRADIVPSELKAHLGWISMVDVIDGGRDFRYRLLGTLVTRYFNWDPTGKTVTEAFTGQPAQLRDAVMGVYRCAVGSRRPVRAVADANWAGQGIEEREALHLPLSDDGETVNVVLHAFVFNRNEVLLNRQVA